VGRVAFCCLFVLMMVAVAAAEPIQITVNGQARTFFLVQPNEPGPHPTIVMLHSGNGLADQEMQISGLAADGPQQGFVAVFPQARGGYWNFYAQGKESAQYRAFYKRHGGVPDDVAFLRSIVADLVRDGISDPKRIYLAGRSLGGVMALRLACVEADRFAAIALLVSTMPDVTGSECEPAKPLPMLVINGTEDRVLPYRGERSVSGYVLWPTRRLITFFRQLNGCAQQAEQSVLSEYQEREVVIERSTECAGGPVVLYSIVGGGHELPAGLNAGRILLDFLHDKKR
jgi:polyhydroxybutyrate depolymerase